MTIYAQGDILIERVADANITKARKPINVDPDGAVILARGEVTGHRHRFMGGDVTMFRDDGLASGVPTELYLGHIKIAAPTADLVHEEHGTITLPKGTYRAEVLDHGAHDRPIPIPDPVTITVE